MRRMHYAWFMLFLGFLAIAAGIGVRSAFSSFIHPWEMEFDITRGTTSTVATISFVIYGLLQPIMGNWADRGNPATVLVVSMGMVTLGLILSSFSNSIWMVAAAYGLISSIGFGGTSQVTGSVIVTRWFQTRRGMAMGIITLAGASGQMLLAPLAIKLNATVGWRQTMLWYALGLAVLAPLIYWLLKPSPAAASMQPYGGGATAAAPAPSASDPTKRSTWRSLQHILSRPNFWYLAVPYFICGVTTIGLIHTHLVPYAEDQQMPQDIVAMSMLILAAANSCGGMISGYLSDRMPRRYLLAGLFSVRLLALAALAVMPGPTALLTLTAVLGLVDMATIAPTTSLAADLLGDSNIGLTYGLISLFHQLGGALGSFLPGQLHDLTGGYDSAFVVAVVALAGAVLFSLRIRELPRQVNQAA